MRKANLAILFLLLLIPSFSTAQVATTYHQSFLIEATSSAVIIDVPYPFQIKSYLGNTVLVETTIEVKNASRQLLEYFIKTGRYEVIRKNYSSTAKLELKPMLRKPITTRQGICEEDILLTFFIPKQLKISTAGKKARAVN